MGVRARQGEDRAGAAGADRADSRGSGDATLQPAPGWQSVLLRQRPARAQQVGRSSGNETGGDNSPPVLNVLWSDAPAGMQYQRVCLLSVSARPPTGTLAHSMTEAEWHGLSSG